MDNGILHFTFGTNSGHVHIILNHFFPTTKARVRKLMLKIVALNLEERKQIAQILIKWLDEQHGSTDYEAALKIYANNCVNARTKASEMEDVIEKQVIKVENVKVFIASLPRGKKKPYKGKLETEKAMLKELRAKRSHYKTDAQYNNGRFIHLQSEQKRLKENMDLIKTISAEWE